MADPSPRTPVRKAFVLFGGGGDLAMRMLHPSLYFLEADGLLPDGVGIVGSARSGMSSEAFASTVRVALEDRVQGRVDETAWERLGAWLCYVFI